MAPSRRASFGHSVRPLTQATEASGPRSVTLALVAVLSPQRKVPLRAFHIWSKGAQEAPMMSMHSLAFLMIGLLAVIVLVGGLFIAVRIFGARAVDSDHPQRPDRRTLRSPDR